MLLPSARCPGPIAEVDWRDESCRGGSRNLAPDQAGPPPRRPSARARGSRLGGRLRGSTGSVLEEHASRRRRPEQQFHEPRHPPRQPREDGAAEAVVQLRPGTVPLVHYVSRRGSGGVPHADRDHRLRMRRDGGSDRRRIAGRHERHDELRHARVVPLRAHERHGEGRVGGDLLRGAVMADPRVWTFFYGSYMNLDVLREVELVPAQHEPARLDGFDIRIAPRANLVRSDACCVWGLLATATHEELARLYRHSKDVLGETYLPEAVLARTGCDYRPALCYI